MRARHVDVPAQEVGVGAHSVPHARAGPPRLARGRAPARRLRRDGGLEFVAGTVPPVARPRRLKPLPVVVRFSFLAERIRLGVRLAASGERRPQPLDELSCLAAHRLAESLELSLELGHGRVGGGRAPAMAGGVRGRHNRPSPERRLGKLLADTGVEVTLLPVPPLPVGSGVGGVGRLQPRDQGGADPRRALRPSVLHMEELHFDQFVPTLEQLDEVLNSRVGKLVVVEVDFSRAGLCRVAEQVEEKLCLTIAKATTLEAHEAPQWRQFGQRLVHKLIDPLRLHGQDGTLEMVWRLASAVDTVLESHLLGRPRVEA